MQANAEEEAFKVNNTSRVKTKELLDIGPPLIYCNDPNHRYLEGEKRIKKFVL